MIKTKIELKLNDRRTTCKTKYYSHRYTTHTHALTHTLAKRHMHDERRMLDEIYNYTKLLKLSEKVQTNTHTYLYVKKMELEST